MDPTIHIMLSRGLRDDGSCVDPISLEEWREAVTPLSSFTITDQMKQQNPFKEESFYMDIPGSGHWKCSTIDGPVWSDDDLIWFRFCDGAVMFTQFSNLADPELVALAEKLGAPVEHYRIGD